MATISGEGNVIYVEKAETLNEHRSKLVKAFQGWTEGLQSYSEVPTGMFGRVAIVKSGDVTLNSEELDLEFEVEFDDDLEANEAHIIIYNLSQTTIEALKAKVSKENNNNINITAGYEDDTGIIFDGTIVKVTSKWEGIDRVTTIKAVDFLTGTGEDVTELTYKAGTKASYILKDLLNRVTMPLVVFEPRRDYTYKDEVKVDGLVWEAIKQYAEVCGISVYVNNRKVYARHLSEGDNINFTIGADTGLIESPEEFEEEITAEDYTDTIKGYKFKTLLQHRLTTGAIINLKSQNVSGQFRVRSGTHTFNESESITEVEVV